SEEELVCFRLCRLGSGAARGRVRPSRLVPRAGRAKTGFRRGPGEGLGHRVRAAHAGPLGTTRRSMRFARRSSWRAMSAVTIAALAVLSLDRGHHAASAQGGRTIRVVVSVPTGGTIDSLVRILADQIARVNGHTLIVESRPGAGGVIAAEAVA